MHRSPPRVMRGSRVLATLIAATFAHATLGCDDATAPPLREVDASSEDGLGPLETITVRSVAELAGKTRVRGHLVLDLGDATVRLPDLAIVDGDLRLVGSESKRVSAELLLPSLVRVGGNVSLAYANGAGRLYAPRLVEVGGHLDLSHGTWSVEFAALERLNGDLRVSDATLTRVELPALGEIGGSVRMKRAALATDVTIAWSALRAVTGDLLVQGGGPMTIDAPRLLEIGGDLVFEDLAASLSMAGLRDIGGDLRFTGVTLTGLDLSTLRSVGDDLVFEDALGEPLESLSLPALQAVPGDLRATGLATLGELRLAALVTVGGDLIILDDPLLASLELKKLATVGRDLVLASVGELSGFAPDALARVGRDLQIARIAVFDARFGKLADVGRDVVLSDVTTTNFGLGALAKIGRDFAMDGITGSIEFDEIRFENLRTIGGSVTVRANPSIEKWVAGALISVGALVPAGDLVIRDNPALIGFSLTKLGAVSGEIVVRDNPSLDSAQAATALSKVQSLTPPLLCGNLGDEACP